jgi:hypothetical protein
MPIRSRFFAPPAAPLPPQALNSRFIPITPITPAPASQFLPPSPSSRFIPQPAAARISKFLPQGITSSPDEDPTPPPPTISPTKRRLHALWKAKNFRKPFS